jgi:hypothetical protein
LPRVTAETPESDEDQAPEQAALGVLLRARSSIRCGEPPLLLSMQSGSLDCASSRHRMA